MGSAAREAVLRCRCRQAGARILVRDPVIAGTAPLRGHRDYGQPLDRHADPRDLQCHHVSPARRRPQMPNSGTSTQSSSGCAALPAPGTTHLQVLETLRDSQRQEPQQPHPRCGVDCDPSHAMTRPPRRRLLSPCRAAWAMSVGIRWLPCVAGTRPPRRSTIASAASGRRHRPSWTPIPTAPRAAGRPRW